MSLCEASGVGCVRLVTSHEMVITTTTVSMMLLYTWLALIVTGFARDDTDEFVQMRRRTVDKALLEVSRLEKRLTKLTQLLANPPSDQGSGAASFLWPTSGAKAQQRALEQSIIDWENDASVSRCPFCQQEFTTYSFRRHHCRLCGRVVCGDPRTGCSTEVGLNVAARTLVRLSQSQTAH